MKIKVLTFVFSAIFSIGGMAQNKTYFVSQTGDDSASGLSQAEAWRTLEKVNGHVFMPGDSILFEKGCVWKGQLKLKGSGSEGRPIVLSSYGKTSDGRPVINIGDAEGAGIMLRDVSWWEIDGMEVTSGAPPKLGVGRQGIVAKASAQGVDMRHIVVRNCYIHDIWGQMGGDTEYSGYFSCAILVHFVRSGNETEGGRKSTINDVLIENNRIERFDKCGIISWGARDNVVVRRNYIENTGGDGIFVNGTYRGLIEFNEVHESCMRSGHPDLPGSKGWWPHTAAVWIQDAEETIMQFNEVYDTGREKFNGDGFAYDFDFNCNRCVAQYNYSRNNHGLMLLMYNISGNITRYNISENDKTHLVQIQGPLSEGNVFYNNVFYLDRNTGDIDFFCGNDNEKRPEDLGAVFYNNIFYATGQGRFRTVYSHGLTESRIYEENIKPNLPSGTLFQRNCYFGPWKNGIPDDPEAICADPMFVAPGTGGRGLKTLSGYKLQKESPCINAGKFIHDNGGRDFYGNVVNDGSIDIGAFEMGGTNTFASGADGTDVKSKARVISELIWARLVFPDEAVWADDGAGVVMDLREALPDSIAGTMSFVNGDGKTVCTVDLDGKLKRLHLKMDTKGMEEELVDTRVRIRLEKDGLTEVWDIPCRRS